MKKIKISGVVVSNDHKRIYDWFGMDCVSPGSISQQLDEAGGDDIEVEINSGGGSVFAGSEIYANIKEYAGKSLVKVMGLAASAASVIAMAGDSVHIAPTAQIMIHNVSTMVEGDYRDLEHEAAVIKNCNTSIANAYRLKTKLPEAELLALMDNETWLDAKQAVEKGFADEVLFDDENKLVASLGQSYVLPEAVINKVRSEIATSKVQEQTNDAKVLRARLSLLNLKGVPHYE